MESQFAPPKPYPRGHVTGIMALNVLSLLVGLALVAGPFLKGLLPGAFETTLHVTLGTLIATLATFRVLLAYGAIWMDVVSFVLGLLTFLLPHNMHMEWNHEYTTAHFAAGGIVMGVAVISAIMSAAVLRKIHPAGV
jgi:hypothetical protein